MGGAETVGEVGVIETGGVLGVVAFVGVRVGEGSDIGEEDGAGEVAENLEDADLGKSGVPLAFGGGGRRGICAGLDAEDSLRRKTGGELRGDKDEGGDDEGGGDEGGEENGASNINSSCNLPSF